MLHWTAERLHSALYNGAITLLTPKKEALHAFIDELQINISDLHRELFETWFLPPPK